MLRHRRHTMCAPSMRTRIYAKDKSGEQTCAVFSTYTNFWGAHKEQLSLAAKRMPLHMNQIFTWRYDIGKSKLFFKCSK